MHRQVCETFSQLDWNNLPPVERNGRLRLLVVSLEALGGRTYNRQLEHYTQCRDDIDAVHIRIRPTLLIRFLARKLKLGPCKVGGITPTAVWSRMLRRALQRLVASGRFDAVHATRQGTALAAARLRKQYPFCFSVTADSTVPTYAVLASGNTCAIDEDEKEIFRAADILSPYSGWVADSAVSDYGVSKDRIQIVRPAPPPSLRRASPPDRLHRQPRLLFTGNDYRHKGWPRLLKWHQTRWADRVELHVVSTRVKYDPRARNVVWHGAVSYHKLMHEILPDTDIFVLPTNLDTYGQVYVEALCCGVPSVGTRQAAIPEIIEDGVTGFTCNRGDDAAYIAAIERLLDNPQLRVRMGIASLCRAAELFDSDRNYNEFLDRLKDTAFNLQTKN